MLTSVSLDDRLPDVLTTRLIEQLGQPITGVQPAAGTFAADFAAVLTLTDSSTLFVKASSEPTRRADYRTEAIIGSFLPAGLFTPTLQGWFEHEQWIVLWFEAVDGVSPVQPWSPTAAEAVLAALRQRAELLSPCPVPSLRTIPDMVAGAGIFTVWRDLQDGRPRALTRAGLDPWAARNLSQLARWEARWGQAVTGDTLCHFDPRADNYLIDQSGRAWTLDWSRGCVGASWIDLATFAVTLAADGYDAEQIFKRNTDSTGIDPDDVNAHLAALAGYWCNAIHQPRGSRTDSLLSYQRRSAAGALAWLRRRSSNHR